jgi:hypothetical protein
MSVRSCSAASSVVARLGSPELIQKSGDAVSRAFAKTLTSRDALRSLWPDLSELPTRRKHRHLAALKRLVDEKQWPWTQEQARALMRHFADVRAIDRLGEAADFSLSRGSNRKVAESWQDRAEAVSEKVGKRSSGPR